MNIHVYIYLSMSKMRKKICNIRKYYKPHKRTKSHLCVLVEQKGVTLLTVLSHNIKSRAQKQT